MESGTTSAIWSAIAASFAALSSMLILRVQTKTLLENARPQIILSDWERSNLDGNEEDFETLTFRAISNVGKGSALHINMNCSLDLDNPTHSMTTFRLPVLPAGDKVEVQQDISIRWNNVPESSSGGKNLSINIIIYCWDTIGNRHETTYTLFVINISPNHFLMDEIIPGVSLVLRKVHSVPVSWLKVKALYAEWKVKVMDAFYRMKR